MKRSLRRYRLPVAPFIYVFTGYVDVVFDTVIDTNEVGMLLALYTVMDVMLDIVF